MKLRRCELCNGIIWPLAHAIGDRHYGCSLAFRIGHEVGRRERLQVVKALVNDPDPSLGNAARVKRLRMFIGAAEARSDGAA